MNIIQYLFPPLRPKSRLPLLPTEWTSDQGRHEPTPDDLWAIFMLKANALAKTDHDAKRVLAEYKGMTLPQTIKAAKRKRRREGRIRKAVRKLKKLWK